MLRTFDISTSGLVAQRQRLNTIATNIANIDSTRDPDGNSTPFVRRLVRFESDPHRGGDGVRYHVENDAEMRTRPVYMPTHPDANDDGYVHYPDINVMTEFVNATEASRAYQANLSAIEMAMRIAEQSLRILQ